MSWYNDETDNSFIDTTQEHIGGSGGSSTTIINEVSTITELEETDNQPDTGTTTTINNVIFPAIQNPQTGSFDLYIKNTNQGGKIFFTTKGDDEEVKIENGRLWGYYNYNATISALTFSKWIDITDDTVRARQAGDNALAAATTAGGVAGGAVLTADAAAAAAAQAAAAAAAAAATANAANASATSLVQTFEAFRWTRRTLSETFAAIGNASFNTLRTSIIARADIAVVAIRAAAAASSRAAIGGMSLSTFNLFAAIVGVYAGAGLTAGVVAGVAYLFDYLRQENDRETLQQYLRLLEENDANGTSLGTTQDVLHLSGLQIVSSTNGGFTTAGKYEVDIDNDAELEITISQTFIATITKVIGGGDSFTTSNTISIPKSSLGGSSS